MKKTLWNISKEFQTLIEDIIENGGVIDEEQEEQLAINRDDASTKLESYFYAIKMLEANADNIKTQEKRLNAMRKASESTIDKLKSKVAEAVLLYGEVIKGKAQKPTYSLLANSVKINAQASKSIKTNQETLPTYFHLFSFHGKLTLEEYSKVAQVFKDNSVNVESVPNMEMIKKVLKTEEIEGVEEEWNYSPRFY